jgi:hypothetical protein
MLKKKDVTILLEIVLDHFYNKNPSFRINKSNSKNIELLVFSRLVGVIDKKVVPLEKQCLEFLPVLKYYFPEDYS